MHDGIDESPEFTPLLLAQRRWVDPPRLKYKVFINKQDYVVVEADSVSQALRLCEVPHPIRVEPYVADYQLFAEPALMTEVVGKCVFSPVEGHRRYDPVVDHDRMTTITQASGIQRADIGGGWEHNNG
jgi:hypothetical protein